jgi:hypothetical protein
VSVHIPLCITGHDSEVFYDLKKLPDAARHMLTSLYYPLLLSLTHTCVLSTGHDSEVFYDLKKLLDAAQHTVTVLPTSFS